MVRWHPRTCFVANVLDVRLDVPEWSIEHEPRIGGGWIRLGWLNGLWERSGSWSRNVPDCHGGHASKECHQPHYQSARISR